MVSQLVKHERIETTVPKAKEVRRLADKRVRLGKEAYCRLCSRNWPIDTSNKEFNCFRLDTLFGIAIGYTAGRYTRLLRTRIRVGDAAPMAYIEFIDRENELRQSKPPTPQPPQRTPLYPWTKSKLSAQFTFPKEERTSSEEDAP